MGQGNDVDPDTTALDRMAPADHIHQTHNVQELGVGKLPHGDQQPWNEQFQLRIHPGTAAGNFRYFETYNVVELVYLTITITLSIALRRFEKRMRTR